jgi:hypothetical protein
LGGMQGRIIHRPRYVREDFSRRGQVDTTKLPPLYAAGLMRRCFTARLKQQVL